MYRIILAVVLTLFHVLRANKSAPKLCVEAKANCFDDILMCGFAYARFESACVLTAKSMSTRSHQNWTNLAPPTQQPCSHECMAAIKGLKRTKRGKELHECNCQLDGKCLIVKARVANCLDGKRGPYNSCTKASANCSQDATCNFLQGKFLEDCHEMINGVKCEKKCLRTMERLFKSTYGKPLAHCECDGPAEEYCRGFQAHSKQLRCRPGMDGSGSPVFRYVNGSIESVESEESDIQGNRDPPSGAHFQSFSWSLLVLVLTLILLS